MDLKKKAPRYLLESRTLTGSVIFIVLFSILFMIIYGPYSSTSWLTLMLQEQESSEVYSGFRMVMASVAFYLVGIIFYNLKKIKFMHLFSNIIMLFGSVYIFFSLFFFY